MGAMKRIATIKQIGLKYCGLPKDQRLAIVNYMNNPPIAPDPPLLPGFYDVLTDYCGNKPSGPGNYILIDLLTNEQQVVKVWTDERHGQVFAIAGQQSWHRIATYNERYHRWLHINRLNDAELKLVLSKISEVKPA